MSDPIAAETVAAAPTTASSIQIRAPKERGAPSSPSSATFVPPRDSITGTWHVTHSTLPMWRKARNVAITYAPLSEDANPKLDDSVTYQGLTGSGIKTVSGIDTPAGDGAWSWRGKGWLMIASSHWQFLGYGGGGEGREGEGWAVTYFQKTLFTPAGIDIYSRRKEGLGAERLKGVTAALAENESEEIRELAKVLFEVKRD
ncbi:hypothetical protein VE01_07371 [Pseudogymnoascus verrucosus]|uniref:Uncharacterized protein n=1 Tax=Pseudogymnoascus verrucosus TaxID=342668 RepID=A0A1B8GGV0_9PEZI|nr:uncharacterized protein VE01_07371 [Pseudogymnoascus verrucosus]OBT95040.1 hypothetical protein VE01_07371 [Pseudogymnoascus verrucosus]